MTTDSEPVPALNLLLLLKVSTLTSPFCSTGSVLCGSLLGSTQPHN
jgi:hypothetical protein